MPLTKSATKHGHKKSLKFEAIGTLWGIESPRVDQLQRKIRQTIAEFEQIFSRFRDDSLVHQMSCRSGEFVLPIYATEMIALYGQLERISGGSFTPLIGKNMIEAGYDSAYSLNPSELTVNERWQAIAEVDGPVIRISQPVHVDFGAAAKGLLVDVIAKLLQQETSDPYIINAGGDIYSSHRLKIGLEHPLDAWKLIGSVELSSGSLCGSSANRRDWGDYHHIIDGNQLHSPRTVLATWATANNTMMADIFSTVLQLVDPIKLKHFDFEYAIIYVDGRFVKSKGFPGTIHEVH